MWINKIKKLVRISYHHGEYDDPLILKSIMRFDEDREYLDVVVIKIKENVWL